MLYIYFIRQNMLKYVKDSLASLLLRPKYSETGSSSEERVPVATEYLKLFQRFFRRKLTVTNSSKTIGIIQLVRSDDTENQGWRKVIQSMAWFCLQRHNTRYNTLSFRLHFIYSFLKLFSVLQETCRILNGITALLKSLIILLWLQAMLLLL